MHRRLRHRGESGQDLVEYALLFPLLMLLIFGIIEFGVIIFTYDTLSNAAREGARVGIIYRPTQDEVRDAVCDAVIERALAVGLTTCGTDPRGDVVVYLDSKRVQVVVQHDARLMTGALLEALGGDPVIPLRAVVTMNRE